MGMYEGNTTEQSRIYPGSESGCYMLSLALENLMVEIIGKVIWAFCRLFAD